MSEEYPGHQAPEQQAGSGGTSPQRQLVGFRSADYDLVISEANTWFTNTSFTSLVSVQLVIDTVPYVNRYVILITYEP
jgi:hypothetical protein